MYIESYEAFAIKEDGSLWMMTLSADLNIRGISLSSDRTNQQIGGVPIVSGIRDLNIIKTVTLEKYEQGLIKEKKQLLKEKAIREKNLKELEVYENIFDGLALLLLFVPGGQLFAPEVLVFRISLGLAEGMITLIKYMNSENQRDFVMDFIGEKLWGRLVEKGFAKIEVILPKTKGKIDRYIISKKKFVGDFSPISNQELARNIADVAVDKFASKSFEIIKKCTKFDEINSLDIVDYKLWQIHRFKLDNDSGYKEQCDKTMKMWAELAEKQMKIKVSAGYERPKK